MILIADSGSTKTDWTLINFPHPGQSDIVATFHTQGINPVHQEPDVIRHILGHELMSQLSTFPRGALVNSRVLETPLLSQLSVFFYGSGCTPVHAPRMKQMLSEVFTPQQIEVHSDLTAAARALCGRQPGVACILGTGSNSCLYDGNDIVANTPALGYILGDEGSGSVLGRKFLNALYKGRLPESLKTAFEQETKLTQASVIQHVSWHRCRCSSATISTSRCCVHSSSTTSVSSCRTTWHLTVNIASTMPIACLSASWEVWLSITKASFVKPLDWKDLPLVL